MSPPTSVKKLKIHGYSGERRRKTLTTVAHIVSSRVPRTLDEDIIFVGIDKSNCSNEERKTGEKEESENREREREILVAIKRRREDARREGKS